MTKQRNRNSLANLRPFAPGDRRINRRGRPKSFDQFRELAQAIAHEKVTNKDGEVMTRVEAILRSWTTSKHPVLQLAFIAYCYGKPPEKLEVNELESKPVLRLYLAHELDDNGQPRPKTVPLPPDADGVHRQWRRSNDDGASKGEGTRRPLLPDAD